VKRARGGNLTGESSEPETASSVGEMQPAEEMATSNQPIESEAPVAIAPEPESELIDTSELDWHQIDAMVKELDNKIDSMGPVNLDAIQEYDELEERYTFLEKQNTDLTNSKAELIEVIGKINQTTRTLFARRSRRFA
jgi:chromosome segregation protein